MRSATCFPHAVVAVGDQREADRIAVAILPHAVTVAVHPAEVVEDLPRPLQVVLIAAHGGVVEVPRRRADRRPLRVALPVQHVRDDGVLVDGVGHRPAEVDVAEPGQLLRREVGRARFRVHARVHVEGQERGPKGRPPAVDREVPLLLQRLQVRVLLPQQPVIVGVAPTGTPPARPRSPARCGSSPSRGRAGGRPRRRAANSSRSGAASGARRGRIPRS